MTQGSNTPEKELSDVPMLMTPKEEDKITIVESITSDMPPGTAHSVMSSDSELERELDLPKFEQVEWDYTEHNIRKKECAEQMIAKVDATQVSPLTLFFSDPEIERRYIYHVNTHSKLRIRIILVIASIFYALWSITDFIIFPDDAGEIVPLRFVVVGASVLTLLFSYVRVTSKRVHEQVFQILLVLLVLLALTMTAIIDYIQNEQTFANMETTGFVMLLAGTTFLLRVVFLYAAITTNFFVIVWGAMALILGATSDENVTRLLVRILIVIGANIIFTLASYESEKRQRVDFKHSVLLLCRHYTALHELKELDDMIRKDGDFNLSAPVEGILKTLRAVRASDNLVQVQREQLAYVDELLRGSRDIYLPNISEQLALGAIDDQSTQEWLQQLQPLPVGARSPRTPRRSMALKNTEGMSQATSASVLQVLGSSTDLLAGTMDEAEHQRMQHKLNDWDFPIFEFEAKMTGTRLPWVVISAANKYGLLQECNIDKDRLKAFLSAVDLGYRPAIAYHNVMHAVDVVHTCNWFLSTGGLYDKLKPIDCFNLLISAAVHDYDHPGHSTAYAIANHTHLALLYNDMSPLENHHAAQTSLLLAQDDLDIFSSYPKDQKQLVRQTIIDLVLATDLKKHFGILATFRSRFEDRSYMSTDREDRLSLMRLLIKCADVSNLCKKHDTMMEWTRRFFEESYAQGDVERLSHKTISPFCDREHPEEAKCETGFIQFIIRPLFSDFGGVYKRIVPANAEVYDKQVMGNLERNNTYWTREKEKEESSKQK